MTSLTTIRDPLAHRAEMGRIVQAGGKPASWIRGVCAPRRAVGH